MKEIRYYIYRVYVTSLYTSLYTNRICRELISHILSFVFFKQI